MLGTIGVLFQPVFEFEKAALYPSPGAWPPGANLMGANLHVKNFGGHFYATGRRPILDGQVCKHVRKRGDKRLGVGRCHYPPPFPEVQEASSMWLLSKIFPK